MGPAPWRTTPKTVEDASNGLFSAAAGELVAQRLLLAEDAERYIAAARATPLF